MTKINLKEYSFVGNSNPGLGSITVINRGWICFVAHCGRRFSGMMVMSLPFALVSASVREGGGGGWTLV